MNDERLQERARRRRETATVRIVGIGDADPVTTGAAAVALVTQLSALAWSIGGRAVPVYARHEIPVRIVSRAS